ncbi:hypothetical protein SAMN06265360_111144 [Haloechinothrix alba]|uniref:Uncharacterized protein n=1 Tax=Haloechinothrix alba TaxID=664784 RepID=A0A238XNY8_9PSEU|nr:hypothetical protein [Haloechinothrix alba]SNR60298.1 hypothetical protein SAMN06265360_111144 [Haloechinothrix alba]
MRFPGTTRIYFDRWDVLFGMYLVVVLSAVVFALVAPVQWATFIQEAWGWLFGRIEEWVRGLPFLVPR